MGSRMVAGDFIVEQTLGVKGGGESMEYVCGKSNFLPLAFNAKGQL